MQIANYMTEVFNESSRNHSIKGCANAPVNRRCGTVRRFCTIEVHEWRVIYPFVFPLIRIFIFPTQGTTQTDS